MKSPLSVEPVVIGSLSPAHTGIALAFVGAIGWAAYYLFIRFGLDAGNVTNAASVALLLNLILFVPAVVLLYYPDFAITPLALAMFVGAGLGSGVFGRLSEFVSTQRVGATRTTPIVSSAGLISTLLAVLVLRETLTPFHFGGILLVVTGVMLTSYETSRSAEESRSLRELGPTIALPLVTAFFYGVEPILVKIGLGEGTPYFVGMAVMIGSAFTGFFAYRLLTDGIPLAGLGGDPGLRWYLASGLCGAVSWVAYLAALDLAPVVVVIPIFDTVPLLVVGFSALFMPSHLERVTPRIVVAALAVVTGAVIVTLSA